MKLKIIGIGLLCFFYGLRANAQNTVAQVDTSAYLIDKDVLITSKQGVTLSAVVVRKKSNPAKLPAALLFFIYTNIKRSLSEAMDAADRGYVGIVADTRGKRLSQDKIEPYEHEVEDVNTVIDWIIQQPWSDGRVGMYGGSYSGFAQWAATKHLHPALKTIVPYVAAIPGLGLPMENNIFQTANYQWAFYVTGNRFTDDAVNEDRQRWRNMREKWWLSGAAYNRIDSIDGQPNPFLQKWLSHPDYDGYWQAMVPYKNDFSKINIPVLSITGYYDDGQVSAMEYFKEHYRYNPHAQHYLIIGPYDHFGAQKGGTPILRGYKVDPVSLINTREITFKWFDYILKGGPRPELIQDRVNYQTMGTNRWRHASSLAHMESREVKFYLTNPVGKDFLLSGIKPKKVNYNKQVVDLADRTQYYNDYYPDPIIKKELDRSNGLFFFSKPFEQAVTVSGNFEGQLQAIINKKDMDVGLILYELTSSGDYFQLSYYLGRASYAQDRSKRKLLVPGKLEQIPFSRSRVFSKKLAKGSRLVVALNINKNPFAEINYGSGKVVSQENIHDAGEPLKIKWSTDSYIKLGISKEK